MFNRSLEQSSDTAVIGFLNLNPTLSQCLLSDCKHDLNEVTMIIEPVLKASSRCHSTPFYIYAVSLGRLAFLTTNLHSEHNKFSTTIPATSWSIGRSLTSGVHISEPSVSRCHAVIGHHSFSNFFITDVGSRNRTWVNGSMISPHSRKTLNDGDVLRFGSVSAEFFSLIRWERDAAVQDITYS
ncbi:MAG: FHA domain-containing protein [Cyanobacteria bacterium P01_E01_bin.6]